MGEDTTHCPQAREPAEPDFGRALSALVSSATIVAAGFGDAALRLAGAAQREHT